MFGTQCLVSVQAETDINKMSRNERTMMSMVMVMVMTMRSTESGVFGLCMIEWIECPIDGLYRGLAGTDCSHSVERIAEDSVETGEICG